MTLPKPVVGFLFIVSLCFLGFVIGGFMGGRFFVPEGAMGFDALASAMGGMFIGVMVALAVGVGAYFRMSRPGLQRATWGALAAVVVVFGALMVVKALRTPSDDPAPGPLVPKTIAPEADQPVEN